MGQFVQFALNHWTLMLALFLVLLFILINEQYAKKTRAKTLSPQVLVNLINEEKVKVIDLRDNESFAKGHIIDAVRANADDFNTARMEKFKNKTIVLVCPRGQQSTVLAAKLRTQGYTDVMVLAGGITAWQGADLPLVKGK